VLRALEASRVRPERRVQPVALLQRADWNFTPADFTALTKRKKELRFAADSAWFPKQLQDNLLTTLKFVLTSKDPVRTAGVNVKDFYHGHFLVPKSKSTKELKAKKAEFGTKADELQGMALGEGGAVTRKNLKAYTKAMQETEKLATPLLEEALKLEGAAVIYHTYEFSGPKMKPGSPIRNILTPIGGSPAGFDPSGVEESANQADKDFDEILQFAFLVDAKGVVHVTVGSTISLSRVTGTPLE
jgi:hypothetical protein